MWWVSYMFYTFHSSRCIQIVSLEKSCWRKATSYFYFIYCIIAWTLKGPSALSLFISYLLSDSRVRRIIVPTTCCTRLALRAGDLLLHRSFSSIYLPRQQKNKHMSCRHKRKENEKHERDAEFQREGECYTLPEMNLQLICSALVCSSCSSPWMWWTIGYANKEEERPERQNDRGGVQPEWATTRVRHICLNDQIQNSPGVQRTVRSCMCLSTSLSAYASVWTWG